MNGLALIIINNFTSEIQNFDYNPSNIEQHNNHLITIRNHIQATTRLLDHVLPHPDFTQGFKNNLILEYRALQRAIARYQLLSGFSIR